MSKAKIYLCANQKKPELNAFGAWELSETLRHIGQCIGSAHDSLSNLSLFTLWSGGKCDANRK